MLLKFPTGTEHHFHEWSHKAAMSTPILLATSEVLTTSTVIRRQTVLQVPWRSFSLRAISSWLLSQDLTRC